MKKTLLTLIMCLCLGIAHGQDVAVMSAGQGNNGEYLVRIVLSTKKDPGKNAEALVKEHAVRSVLFKGVAPCKDYQGHAPLVADPAAETTKAPLLEAFWRDGTYLRYVTLQPGTLSVMKNRQTKMVETSAELIINKESLVRWLEENKVIEGFSDLW